MEMAKTRIEIIGIMVFRDEAPFLTESVKQLQEMCSRVILQDNGSTDGSIAIVEKMLRPKDTFITTQQKQPYDLAEDHNQILNMIDEGQWILKWDADELPTLGLKHVAEYLTKYADRYNVFGIPIYHMRTPTQALGVEYGFAHTRLYIKQAWTRYEEPVHARLIQPLARANTFDVALGMGMIHWSYFCDSRLKRKEEWYAKQPSSGHGKGTLVRNWNTGLRDLPPNMEYKVADGWLEAIKNA
jgi:glycosyltransferase involved in cell wall biosynthesis